MQDNLLIELRTEELPPKALQKLGASFARTIVDELVRQGFVSNQAEHHEFASPRRLAVSIANVLALQPFQQLERRGPAVANGLKDGQPTPALAGFAKSCGVQVDQLERMHDGKNEIFVHRYSKEGEALQTVLPGIVELALKKLPAPKMMRWGDKDGMFIRPVHGLIMLHGGEVIAGSILGLTSGQTTLGHRFLSSGELRIDQAGDYARVLFEQGKVIASLAARKANIADQLARAAMACQAMLADHTDLLDEVTGLVEWPVVYVGRFDEAFLQVPQECLILSMQQHQKYFPLLSQDGKLLPTFLVVSNLQTDDPSHIIQGNERVLRARLSDARFFYDQDQKQRLEDRVPRLAQVVYHNKLGSQLERTMRVQRLSGLIARELGADAQQAERAAWLAKADLLTDMVGEFPELQGIMGLYYARRDGEPEPVAAAIEAHYHPRFAGDSLPQGPVAAAVALADKLDTLAGIWGIGLIPTGDKDPFGLRRHALGVLRILLETPLPLDLKALLADTVAGFTQTLATDTVDGLFGFMLERLRNYLASLDLAGDVIEAVVSQQPSRIDQVQPRIEAVTAFRSLPQAEALAAANKRISNILKKVEGGVSGQPVALLLQEPAEKALFSALDAAGPQVAAHMANRAYADALTSLASLRGPVDAFFEDVMVMADDAAIRQNRLALLLSLQTLMNQVADISRLAN